MTGHTDDPPPFGAVVRDRENGALLAVVVNRPPVPANEWEVEGGLTVADWDTNAAYPDDAPVVIVVPLEAMREAHPEYDGADPIRIADLQTKPYAFPAPRLVSTGRTFGASNDGDGEDDPQPEPEPEPEPPESLTAVAERLADGGCEVHVSVEAVTASKLGEQYVVRPDGTVEGDGALARQVEAAVGEVLADVEVAD